jgi:hypothetical protein
LQQTSQGFCEIERNEPMLKRFDWIPRYGALAVLTVILYAPDSSAQPRPLQEQSGAQKQDAAVEAATLPDSVTVPDGTPLTLKLEEDISSATAKVGDTVKFTTPYPVRVNGSVIVPTGTAVSGTVVQVSHPHRPSTNGRVRMAVEKVVLPSGEIVALRPSKSVSGKRVSMAAPAEPGDLGVWGWALVSLMDPITTAIVLPFALSTKGHELVYQAGTRTLVYFNGPLDLDRATLLKLQPAPYKGPAQVFFNNTAGISDEAASANFDALFCGEVRVGPLIVRHSYYRQLEVDRSVPLRLELNPGTYSFTARLDLSDVYERYKDVHRKANKKLEEKIAKEELESKLNAKPVQLEVREDHQYWIDLIKLPGRDHRGLFVKDPQQHQTEFDIVQYDLPVTDKDFTSLPSQDSCPQAALP